ILVLVALIMPSMRTAREPARRTQCKNNLKQIGLALHNYHDTYDAFPPAFTTNADGQPLHSWRTLILPYLDQKELYEKIDLSKPCDDPINQAAFNSRTLVYLCPSSPAVPPQTTYLALVASNSCMQPNLSKCLSDISVGSDKVLLVIEVPSKQSVHW